MFNVAFARSELLDFVLVDVKTDTGQSSIRKRADQWQPNVAQSNDTDRRGPGFDFVLKGLLVILKQTRCDSEPDGNLKLERFDLEYEYVELATG